MRLLGWSNQIELEQQLKNEEYISTYLRDCIVKVIYSLLKKKKMEYLETYNSSAPTMHSDVPLRRQTSFPYSPELMKEPTPIVLARHASLKPSPLSHENGYFL
jgi:hypothetical protein